MVQWMEGVRGTVELAHWVSVPHSGGSAKGLHSKEVDV